MVCTSKDLLEWKDFPNGLKLLVLDKDVSFASELKSKLEGMHYIVSTFHCEDEALSTIHNNFETFHVAIVEINTINNNGDFKFLQMTKGLPTIIVAETQCMTTTMKCISLGAIEVLIKPVCDDKLRNIWQHVLRKVYKTGESVLPESTTPVTNSTNLTVNNDEIQCLSDDHRDYDKYSAPSTPQLKQDDDAGCNVRSNWSNEKDRTKHYEESKSVETACFNEASYMPSEPSNLIHDSVLKVANDSVNEHRKNEIETKKSKALVNGGGPCGHKTNRKKMKVDWTSDLHKKFIQAVEKLGIDQAIPSRILELMKVEGLTRHNVASHLQKYRMQRRHSLPKNKQMRISLRPNHTTHHNASAPNQGYPVWTQLGSHTAGLQPWCGHFGSSYQTWPWKSYSMADAWGCPVMMPSLIHGVVTNVHDNMSLNLNEDRLVDEVIDKIIKEAMDKPPWVPLPIGLKAPSMESVMVELSKQGISSIPPYKKHQSKGMDNV